MRYVAFVYETAKELGYDLDEVFDRFRLTPEEFRNPETLISDDLAVEISDWLVSRVDWPGFGLLVGQRQSMADHGMLGFAMLSSANLNQLIEIYLKYEPIVFAPLVVSVSHAGDDLVLIWRERRTLGQHLCFYAEENFATWHSMFAAFPEAGLNFAELRFAYSEPSYGEKYRDLFRCPVRFDADEFLMRFPAEKLEVPFSLESEAAKRICERECHAILRQMGSGTEVVFRVQSLLLRSREKHLSLEEAAEQLNMAPRSLRRRLTECGATYSQLVLETRMALASRCLTYSNLPLHQIASSVGYADLSAFYRAFKKWSGTTPADYRLQEKTAIHEARESE